MEDDRQGCLSIQRAPFLAARAIDVSVLGAQVQLPSTERTRGSTLRTGTFLSVISPPKYTSWGNVAAGPGARNDRTADTPLSGGLASGRRRASLEAQAQAVRDWPAAMYRHWGIDYRSSPFPPCDIKKKKPTSRRVQRGRSAFSASATRERTSFLRSDVRSLGSQQHTRQYGI